MAYIEELTEDSVPLLRRSFVGAATAEILDPKREGEPVDFKQNYPHYNFSDDTSKTGSTRFDSCFKNHGAEDVRESDRGLAVTCMPCRPVRVIAVPKQKIQVEVPAPVALKPRPYVPATTVIKVPHCSPIKTIVSEHPMIKEANAELMKEIEENGCSACDITVDEMKQAIEAGYDPFDGVTVSPVIEEVVHPEVPATNAEAGSQEATTEKPKATTKKPKAAEALESKTVDTLERDK